MSVIRNISVAAVGTIHLSGCGVSGADPTGTVAMIQFEQHRQRSNKMQQQVTSSEHQAEMETNLRNAIQYCKQNIEASGCRQVVQDEAKTMETVQNMRKIGGT